MVVAALEDKDRVAGWSRGSNLGQGCKRAAGSPPWARLRAMAMSASKAAANPGSLAVDGAFRDSSTGRAGDEEAELPPPLYWVTELDETKGRPRHCLRDQGCR